MILPLNASTMILTNDSIVPQRVAHFLVVAVSSVPYIYSFLFVLGVPGTICVLFSAARHLIAKEHGKRRIFRTHLKNNDRVQMQILILSFVDLMALSMLPMLITDSLLNQHWPFGAVLCKMYYSIENVMKFLSIGILTFMATDRYLLLSRNRPMSSRSCNLFAGVTTLLVGLCIIPFTYYTSERIILLPHQTVIRCATNFSSRIHMKTWMICVFTLGFVIPGVIITFFYSRIIGITLKHKRFFPQSTFSSRRVMFSVLRLVVFYYVCWTPYWTTCFAIFLPQVPRWFPYLATLIHTLPYVNCSSNWILYAWLNKDIRATLPQPRVPPISMELYHTIMKSSVSNSCQRLTSRRGERNIVTTHSDGNGSFNSVQL